jgi:hypothetical protein
MTKIYRTSDIIPLKVDGLRIGISPLTFDQKMEVQAEILKGDAQGAMRGAALAVRCAVKELSGIKTTSGDEYELSFEDGMLSQDCWDDLCNIAEGSKLTMVCLNLINGVPKDFIDPNTGEKIEGVSVIQQESSRSKKK